MRYFKVSGLWFLDEAAQNRVPGILSYSKRGLRLRLFGGFTGGWSPGTVPYPLIRGIVGRNSYGGEFVTLIDCFTKSSKLTSAGIGEETIYCNRGIIGDSHLEVNHTGFESIDIGISYLSDWFGRGGIAAEIVPGAEAGLDVHYRTPDAIHCSLGPTTLRLGLAGEWSHSSRKIEITEEAYLSFGPLPNSTVEQAHGEFIRPLQNLLSFATDTPNALEWIRLRGEKVRHGESEQRRRYHLLFRPIFRLGRGRKKERLTREDMLFDYDEAGETGQNIFEKWLEFTKRHEAFCTVYFAMLYGPPSYLEEKFLRLMSAFMLLTASLEEAEPRTVSFWVMSASFSTTISRTGSGP